MSIATYRRQTDRITREFVYFSRSLSFSYHINCYLKENFEKKYNYIIKLLGGHGSLNRIYFGDALWKSLIRPSIIHGCTDWMPCSNASVASLESRQYKVAKVDSKHQYEHPEVNFMLRIGMGIDK